MSIGEQVTILTQMNPELVPRSTRSSGIGGRSSRRTGETGIIKASGI